MDTNYYQAPESHLVDQTTADHSFYVVSMTKFTVLFFATFGVYSVYWFYKNWTLHKKTENLRIWPVPRAIFNIFFAHSLFRRVNDLLQKQGITFNWSHDLIATLYVIVTIISNVSDRLSAKDIGSPYSDLISLATLPLTYWVLQKAQRAINHSQRDPLGLTNAAFTAANYVWIGLGLLIWAMTILGTLILLDVIQVDA